SVTPRSGTRRRAWLGKDGSFRHAPRPRRTETLALPDALGQALLSRAKPRRRVLRDAAPALHGGRVHLLHAPGVLAHRHEQAGEALHVAQVDRLRGDAP